MKNLLLLLIVSLTLFSCGENKILEFENNDLLEVVDSIEVDPMFGVSSTSAFELDGKSYFSVANYKTQKEVRIYNSSGELVKTFDLTPFMDFQEGIMSYEVLDLKNLLVIIYKDNRVYFLNDEGRITKSISFENEIEKLGGVSVIRNMSPSFLLPNSNNIYLSLVRYADFSKFINSTKEEALIENKKNYLTPRLIYIEDIKSENPIVKSALPDPFNGMNDYADLLFRTNHFIYSNDKFLISLDYSNKINIFDSEFNKIETRTIESDFVQIGYTPPNISNFIELNEIVKENEKGKSVIYRVFNDSKTGNYVVVLMKRGEDGNGEKVPNTIIYDSNWNKLGEIDMAKHVMVDAIQSGNKLYIKRQNKNIYDVFECVEN